jgi:3-hydroxyacyl-CoA dehydrogenase
MDHSIRRFAIVGLGKMGGNLALNAVRAGFEIIGVDPKGVPQELARSGIRSVSIPKACRKSLRDQASDRPQCRNSKSSRSRGS